jgi:hypothetical protein
MRITKALATECKTCHGVGYTDETGPRMETAIHPEFGEVEVRTLEQGYACLVCCGLGQQETLRASK